VFERFTEQARQVVVHAQDEARTLGHNYIGTEHLLLGVLRGTGGIAADLLESRAIGLSEALERVLRTVGRGEWRATGQLAFTTRAKRALELSVQEALERGDSHVRTEHILLGLTRIEDGIAARVLLDLGTSPGAIAQDVRKQLGGHSGSGLGPSVPTDQSEGGAASLPAPPGSDLRA
jgi:ATP-dependent Clp protease ATP-binding subunit ClpC